uniref:Secreted protein n=2 Tax=Caenorhabditis tropicalis TaxID=1561998 RepID=A0A1I7T5S8_9PELO
MDRPATDMENNIFWKIRLLLMMKMRETHTHTHKECKMVPKKDVILTFSTSLAFSTVPHVPVRRVGSPCDIGSFAAVSLI